MTTQPRPVSTRSDRFEEHSPPESLTDSSRSSAQQSMPTSPMSTTLQPQASRFNWFHSMPVRQKQLLALFASEALSAIGLVGAGSWLIVRGGQEQLVNQAKSEVAVTKVTYDIKVNQMGFGFRGQSDNTAIVQAAKDYAAGRSVSPELRAKVKAILANEVTARNMEYATLVGPDLRIISSANAERIGDRFDPDGLVGTVLGNPRQIKANSVVNWSELKKESPPLPEGFSGRDALIRYTVTPVKDTETGTVIGTLVSGDIVNEKTPIVEGTLEAFNNGYSAVYQRQPNGAFALSTSLDLADAADPGGAADLKQAKTGVALPASSTLLQRAAEAKSKAVTDRVTLGNQTYTVAAQALNNFKGQPVAILVRGSSEAALDVLLRQTLLLQLAVAAIAIAADVGLALLLGRSIATPIEVLGKVARRFTKGDRQVRAEGFANNELGKLAIAFNEMADNVVTSETMLKEQYRRQELIANRAQLLTEVTLRIRQSMNAEEILSTSVEGVRSMFKADRVLIYKFTPDFKGGEITAESVGEGWIKALGQTIYDPLMPGSVERFKSGRISTMENLAESKISRCHCEILERLEVQANMVAPIITGDDLVGLLCVHQCSGPRVWELEELDLNAAVVYSGGLRSDSGNFASAAADDRSAGAASQLYCLADAAVFGSAANL